MDKERKPRLFTKNFVFIFFIDILFATCFGLSMAVLPLWLSDYFNADSATIGMILGLSGLSTLLSRPFMGYAIDRWGRKKILHMSLCIFGILNFFFLFTQNLWLIFIIRFLQCIPFAAVTTCNITIATDFIPEERRGEGFSYFTAAATLPMAIGPAIGLALYKVSWFWPFIATGLIALFCFVISLLIKIQFYKPQINKLSIQSLFNKKLLSISLLGAISISVMPGLLSYLTLYVEEIALDLDLVGVILMCYAVCLFLVRVFGAKFINQTNPKITGSIALVFLGVGTFVLGVCREIIGLAIGAIMIGIGFGIILPTMFMMAARIAPDQRGVSNSMVFGGVDVAQSGGSYGFGAIANLVGTYGNTYLVFSGFEIIGLLVFLLLTVPQFEKDTKAK